MPVAHVTQKDVDALLQPGKLSISGQHRWRTGDNKSWAKIDIPVRIEIDDQSVKNISLRMVISTSMPDPEKRDYALLWNNIPVRRLCIGGSHSNRHTNSERWLRQTHKHVWTDNCLDRFAYTPTDITAPDIHGQFAQFCSECGILCSATFGAVPAIQGGLHEV